MVRADNEPVKPFEKKHVAKLHGEKTDFTYGEVTAMMGDLFGHWERLYNANEEQREHLMGEDTTVALLDRGARGEASSGRRRAAAGTAGTFSVWLASTAIAFKQAFGPRIVALDL